MRFYFDESGEFSPPNEATEHRAAIIVGVDIPESIEADVFHSFEKFVGKLSANEFSRGEPKGRLLSDESRRLFCEMMAAQEAVFITPTILDLTSLADGVAEEGTESLIRKMKGLVSQCKYESMAEETQLLASQISNLSIEQNLRLVALAHCIFRTLKNCIIFRAGSEYSSCWDEIIINIDSVQRRPNSREQLVFEKMVLAWLAAWSKSDPVILIKEIHTAEHPFVKRYSAKNGIDFGALLRGRFRWESSASSRGLQIADMSATINSLAIRRIVNTSALRDYGVLMRRSGIAPEYAPGLLTLGENEVDLGARYTGLLGAIKEARKK